MAAAADKKPPLYTLPQRAVGRVVKGVLKVMGGAVYYAIYRKLPDDKADPYWAEMHPDDDKGTSRDRGPFFQSPPSI